MTKAGKIDINAMKKFVNKKVGLNIAHDLNEDNPTEVKEWIPTGSRWLDSIACRGKLAGIPVGKVTEIAGLESTGKSYMAADLVATTLTAMGIDINRNHTAKNGRPIKISNGGSVIKELIL